MTNLQNKRRVHRGRLFPEIQWSEEKKAAWKAQQEEFYQRCWPIFEQVKPELITTHYNWYLAVEPDSGDYFLAKDDDEVMYKCRQKYPNSPFYLFRINETGVSGTL